MALLSARAPQLRHVRLWRSFATFTHIPPSKLPSLKPQPEHISRTLDESVLVALGQSSHGQTSLSELVDQYTTVAGRILEYSLPYEPRPTQQRRPLLDDSSDEVVLVVHCARVGKEHKITVSTGFALAAQDGRDHSLILTCAHTLEEIRHSQLLSTINQATDSVTGTYIIWGPRESPRYYPVSRVVAALPQSDLIVLSCKIPGLKTLPISPYPARKQAALRVHLISHQPPAHPGWHPWIGGTWRKWVDGEILGYRDFAGREAEPGTYDALNHLYFAPIPTFGSSGGPIVEKESGAVVGVMLGARMDSRVEGMRGWGVPAETIFEMFALPGLEGKQ